MIVYSLKSSFGNSFRILICLLSDSEWVASSGDRSVHSEANGSSLNVDNLVVIGTIIDLVVVGGLGPVIIPSVVDWPGAWNPLSHLIVILDGRLWWLWLSDPVENLVVISRVINALWPWVVPVSVWLELLGVNAHNLLLDKRMVLMVVVMLGIDTDSQKGRKC